MMLNALPALGINQVLEETVFRDRFSYTRQWQSEALETDGIKRLKLAFLMPGKPTDYKNTANDTRTRE